MRVIGGAYFEEIREPISTEFYGSGLRAASVLSGSTNVRLQTAVDPDYAGAARAIASTFGFELEMVARPLSAGFRYYTQLSSPTIEGTNQDPQSFTVSSSEPTLVFGMIDGRANVEAPVVIFDPQRPRGARSADLETISTKRLAIVANHSEVLSLGRSDVLETAVRNIQQLRQVEVIIVKRGPLGATIFEEAKMPTQVGPYRTDSVWSIGSGDVFTAAFSWAWAVDNRTPHAAAELASAATSAYCSTRSPEIKLTPGILPSSVAIGTRLKPRQTAVRVYLAGPFFCLSQRWLIDLSLQALRQHGAQVFSPLHDVGLGGDEVAKRDILGLDESEVIFGLLDGVDAGTLFELGYGYRSQKPVVGYAENCSLDEFKMLRGLDIPIHRDLASAIYDVVWSGMEADV